jgi:nucleotide-binding universal stress UspA family protein
VPFGGVFPWRWPLPEEYTTNAVDEALAREETEAERIAVEQAPPGAVAEGVFGDPVEAIRRAAEDENADLIVVGANDKGFLDRLLHGSVSEDLARHAERPVLVVR